MQFTGEEILKKYWGYDGFRPLQKEVIDAVFQGWDVLAVMPTGAGKSLLYQVPGMMKEGVCIVITPLIALMKDQVDRLRRAGIPAAAIHSGLSGRKIDFILDNCCWGDMKFLYIAPERAAGSLFRARLATMKVNLFAVDEAHCISQWGYDFRPSYLKIAELRELMPSVPFLALTASATKEVAADITAKLELKNPELFTGSFARPNISFAVRYGEDKPSQMLRVVNNVGGSGIIYAGKREATEKLAAWLRSEGHTASYYHGDMSSEERAAAQERWMKGESRIMVATNAFGMGIDKPDVRFVLHYRIPDSPEAYYQEAGRAGRDGRRSYAVLLCADEDKRAAIRRFENEFYPMEKIRKCYEAVFNYLGLGVGDGKYTTWNFDTYDFARRFGFYSGAVRSMIGILQQNGYMSLSDEADNPPRIAFTVSRDELYKVRIDTPALDHFIRTLLRMYTGLFSGDLVEIDEAAVGAAAGYEPHTVRDHLKMLWQHRVIKYVPGRRSPLLTLLEERLPAEDVYISRETYHTRREMYRKRLDAMFGYADTAECRSVYLARYFGEPDPAPCGACDRCLDLKKVGNGGPVDLPEKIVSSIRSGNADIREIIAKLAFPPEQVTAAIERLAAEGTVSVDASGRVQLIESNDKL